MQTDVVNREDVGMAERGNRAGFEFEAMEAIGITGQLAREHFQGDVAAETGIAGAVDFAHAAGSDEPKNLIGTESIAGSESHASSVDCIAPK